MSLPISPQPRLAERAGAGVGGMFNKTQGDYPGLEYVTLSGYSLRFYIINSNYWNEIPSFQVENRLDFQFMRHLYSSTLSL